MSEASYGPTSVGLLQPLQSWLQDPDVSEILINRPQEVWVESKGLMRSHRVCELDRYHLSNLMQLIANENQQVLNEKYPLLSGSLLDGSRVQLVVPPAAANLTISIRRQMVCSMTLADYVNQGFFSSVMSSEIISSIGQLNDESEEILRTCYQKGEWHQLLRHAMALKKNIVISGGTSSGKTTLLNACLAEIPEEERIITLEDTREIQAPHRNQVNLLASKGLQGMAKVTMQDLLQCSLRLRPDRIIVGEIRGAEILDFLAAASTGHDGSLTSIHASNPQMALMRMTQMYKLNNVPAMTDDDIMAELKQVIDFIIQLKKTPEGRRLHSVCYIKL